MSCCNRRRRRHHCRNTRKDFRKRAKKSHVAGMGCCHSHKNVFTC